MAIHNSWSFVAGFLLNVFSRFINVAYSVLNLFLLTSNNPLYITHHILFILSLVDIWVEQTRFYDILNIVPTWQWLLGVLNETFPLRDVNIV